MKFSAGGAEGGVVEIGGWLLIMELFMWLARQNSRQLSLTNNCCMKNKLLTTYVHPRVRSMRARQPKS